MADYENYIAKEEEVHEFIFENYGARIDIFSPCHQNNDILDRVVVRCFQKKRYDIIMYILFRCRRFFIPDIYSRFYSGFDDLEAFDFLYQRNATPNLASIFITSSKYGNIDMLKHIVKKRNFIPQYPRDRYRCVENAIKSKHFEIVEYLIRDMKFNIDQQDNLGFSYLHHAISLYSPKEMVCLLIDLGINADLKNEDGYTALELLMETGPQGVAGDLVPLFNEYYLRNEMKEPDTF